MNAKRERVGWDVEMLILEDEKRITPNVQGGIG